MVAAEKNPDDLYEEYKTARNERRRKAAERRNKKPNAQWDLPMVEDKEDDDTGALKSSSPHVKPEWYQQPDEVAPSAGTAEVAAPRISAPQ